MRPKVVLGILLAVAVLLAVPYVAMRYTDQVAWGPGDFVVAAVLLAGTGLLFEFAASRVRNSAYRGAVALALAGTLALVWINLAVGMIGDEGNPANLMYLGVIAVGALGAVVARFRPPGMARALFAMALAQALVGVIVLVARWNGAVPLDAGFAALWVASALLFQRASGTGANGRSRSGVRAAA